MSDSPDYSPVFADSDPFVKALEQAYKSGKSIPQISSSSFDYGSQLPIKHSMSTTGREDSVSSKSSFSSIFPNIKRSFDNASSFSVSQTFVPRPEKTLALFDRVITTLKKLHHQYSVITRVGDSVDGSEEGEICNKVDKRILLLQSLKSEYESMIEEKEAELNGIKVSVISAMESNNGKEDIDMVNCETYWSICREMCIIESKLERCSGKLQFQIIELDSVSRVNPFDQYELTIRLNDISKFKTKIKIEKNGRQIWDNTTFVLMPTVDDVLDVKFTELKTLNKGMVLLEKKVASVNRLILPDTNIYTLWLTPVGTIKLSLIVQWNSVLDDPELYNSLSHIDNKYHDNAIKDNVIIRSRANTAIPKHINNRPSIIFNSMGRSDAVDQSSPRGSMTNTDEQGAEGRKGNVNIRKVPIARDSSRAIAEYHDESPRQQRSNVIITDVSNANTVIIDCAQRDKQWSEHKEATVMTSNPGRTTDDMDINDGVLSSEEAIEQEVKSDGVDTNIKVNEPANDVGDQTHESSVEGETNQHIDNSRTDNDAQCQLDESNREDKEQEDEIIDKEDAGIEEMNGVIDNENLDKGEDNTATNICQQDSKEEQELTHITPEQIDDVTIVEVVPNVVAIIDGPVGVTITENDIESSLDNGSLSADLHPDMADNIGPIREDIIADTTQPYIIDVTSDHPADIVSDKPHVDPSSHRCQAQDIPPNTD